MPDQKRGPIIHVELYLKKCALPEFIGQKGKNVRALIKETGVLSIIADRQRINKFKRCPIGVTGSTKAVKLAKTVIRKQFSSYLMEKKIVWIPKTEISGFGRKGRYAKAFKNEPGIEYCEAEEHEGIRGLFPVRIEGSVAAVDKVVAIVISRHDGYLKVTPSFATQANDSKDWSKLDGVPEKDPKPEEASFQVVRTGCEEVPAPVIRSPWTVCPSSATSLESVTTTETVDTKPLSWSSLSAPMAGPNVKARVLLDFLSEYQSSFKCSVVSFHQWLESVDIESLEDLAEALADDEFVQEKMKSKGFKVFKQSALARAVKTKMNNFSEQPNRTEKISGVSLVAPTQGILPFQKAGFHDEVVAANGQQPAIGVLLRPIIDEGVLGRTTSWRNDPYYIS